MSQERRSRWISAISRADLTDEILYKDRGVEDILFLDMRPKPGMDTWLTGCLH